MMEEKMWVWVKSIEDLENEYFNNLLFETREEAIEEVKQIVAPEEKTVVIVRCREFPLCNVIDAEYVLEYLDNQYRSWTGCDTYVYDGITQEEEEWLEAEISRVIDKFHEKNENKASMV